MSETAAVEKEGQIVSEKDALKGGLTAVQLWLQKIDAAKSEEEGWRKRAKRAADIYEAKSNSAFNIFHANVDIMESTLYNSTPTPDIRRRYEPAQIDADALMAQLPPNIQDQQQAQAMLQQLAAQAQQQAAKDAKINKTAADIIERVLMTTMDQHPFDKVMRKAVREYKTIGRGVPRIRYKATVGEDDEIVTQSVVAENVPWDRFGRGPGTDWTSVPFIWFYHDLTRDAVKTLLDGTKNIEERLDKLGFNDAGSNDGTDTGSESERRLKGKGILKTIPVFEAWCKDSRKVYFFSPNDVDDYIKTGPPPIRLEGFFCCPQPLQMMRINGLEPLCPYDVYAKLCDELDEVTRRISALVKQMRVRGLYDPKMAPDFEKLKDAEDGDYISASASEAFVKGEPMGLSEAVLHWPLDTLAAALKELYAQRDAIKQTIYEVTGISDVLRGATNPNETLGAQEIKQSSASMRVQTEQAAVADLARNLFRMMTEVICDKFEPQTIEAMSGLKLTPDVLAVLKDAHRTHKIDIETDSTIRADLQRRHEETKGFLEATAQFAQAMGALAPLMPQLAGPLVTLYSSTARQWKLGKQAEDALDQLSDMAEKGVQVAQQNSGPSPEEIQQQQQQQAHEQQQAQQAADLQRQQQEHDQAMQVQQQQHEQAIAERQAQHEQMKAATEAQKAAADIEMKRIDHQIKLVDLEIKKADLAATVHKTKVEAQTREFDAQAAVQQHDMDVQDRENEREHAEEMQGIEREGAEGKIAHQKELAAIKAKQASKPKPSNGARP